MKTENATLTSDLWPLLPDSPTTSLAFFAHSKWTFLRSEGMKRCQRTVCHRVNVLVKRNCGSQGAGREIQHWLLLHYAENGASSRGFFFFLSKALVTHDDAQPAALCALKCLWFYACPDIGTLQHLQEDSGGACTLLADDAQILLFSRWESMCLISASSG